MFRRTHGLAFAHAIAVAHDTTARCSRGATAKTPLPTLHSLKDSRYASQVISDAFPGTADSIRRSGVAEKPQAAAIRAETLDRELIATGFARSVGRGAIIRPRGTARAIMGKRGGSRPQGLGYAFIRVASAGTARRGTGCAARRDSRQRDPDRASGPAHRLQPRGAARERLFQRGCDPRSKHRPRSRCDLGRSNQRLEYAWQLDASERPDKHGNLQQYRCDQRHHFVQHVDQHHRLHRRRAGVFIHGSEQRNLHQYLAATLAFTNHWMSTDSPRTPQPTPAPCDI